MEYYTIVQSKVYALLSPGRICRHKRVGKTETLTCPIFKVHMDIQGTRKLNQSQCFRVIDEIAEINPHILLILTGGETAITPGYLGDIEVCLRYRVSCCDGYKWCPVERRSRREKCKSMVLPAQALALTLSNLRTMIGFVVWRARGKRR